MGFFLTKKKNLEHCLIAGIKKKKKQQNSKTLTEWKIKRKLCQNHPSGNMELIFSPDGNWKLSLLVLLAMVLN